jgi:hypothetical protein
MADEEKAIIVREGEDIVVRAEREMVQPTAIVALDLLEEIADRLATLEELTRAEHPQGRAPMRTFSASGTDLVEVRDSTHKWFSISVFNDGPDTVFIRVNNKLEDNPIELQNGEQTNIDMKTGIIEKLYFNCNEGESASGRIISKY